MIRILLAGSMYDGDCRADMTYCDAVRDVGAVPVIAMAYDPAEADALAEDADGLILRGGADVDHALYGQEPHPLNRYSGELRDRSDGLLLKAFSAKGKPVLGICRGCQIANVVLGGTLIQHVPEVCGHKHQNTEHAVSILPGSLLASLLGEEDRLVNSFHHQAIARPAAGLTVCAWSEDGIIEAAEMKGILLIQWHPERMGEPMRPLFDWVCGRRVSGWGIGEDNTVMPVPPSPPKLEGEELELELVPLGCMHARLSVFPHY